MPTFLALLENPLNRKEPKEGTKTAKLISTSEKNVEFGTRTLRSLRILGALCG